MSWVEPRPGTAPRPPRVCCSTLGASASTPFAAHRNQRPLALPGAHNLPTADCPKCGYEEAFFLQIQTRSADEPATLFFRCANITQCNARWNE